MAFHEFGIMQDLPKGRYDKYEPEKYKTTVFGIWVLKFVRFFALKKTDTDKTKSIRQM